MKHIKDKLYVVFFLDMGCSFGIFVVRIVVRNNNNNRVKVKIRFSLSSGHCMGFSM